MNAPKLARALLLLVVALAALLRFDGLDRLLPNWPEPDSYIELQVRLLREGREPDVAKEKGYFAYPTMIARGLALLGEPRADETKLDCALAASSGDLLRARRLSAALSLLLVVATFFIARRFASPLAALMASALVALSLNHLYFSQQGRPHAAHASFAALALLALLQMRRNANWSSQLAAHVLVFLAIATLHNGAALIGPFVVAHALLGMRDGRFDKRVLLRGVIGIALFAGVTFVAYRVFYPAQPVIGGETGFELGGHNTVWQDYDGSGFALCAKLMWDYDPGLAVLAAIGLALALLGLAQWWRAAPFERRADLCVVLAYALPYALFIGMFRETSDRFLLPLLPFLACLAGVAIDHAVGVVPRFARPLILGAALVVPAFGALRYVRVRSARDTLEQAADFVAAHVDRAKERVVVSTGLVLPLFSAKECLDRARDDYVSKQRHWLRYQFAHESQSGESWLVQPLPGKVGGARDPALAKQGVEKFLTALDPEWIVVESSLRMRDVASTTLLREWAATHGELAATLRGEQDVWRFSMPLDYQDVPYLFLRLSNATAFGPTIEIYRRTR